MGLSLFTRNIRGLWREWELRLLVLLSLFLQLTLASLGSKRKSMDNSWIQFVVWTTYLLAEAVAILSLGVLSNHLANIKEMKGTFDPRSQITALWAPFFLLHLGGPDTITAFALADNELWLRQLARLCVQVGLASYIYFMALLGSPLSILAEGMILVGFIKYAERALCLFLASNARLRDSMQPIPILGPIYPRKVEQYVLKKEEGYSVRTDEVEEIWAPGDLSVTSEATTLVKAYELFEIFKLLFVGLILNSGDLEGSRRFFQGQSKETAFKIVEMELGFMYDQLYTKVPLLNCAWGVVRWVVNLLVPCAVLVLFSLQNKKDYPKVDLCITFLLISLTVTLEIYSLLQIISSDWVNHWRLQRPWRSTISSTINFLRFLPNQRWGNSVAQFSLLRLFYRKRNRIFRNHPRLFKLDQKVEKNFYVRYKALNKNVKEQIYDFLMMETPEEKSFAPFKEQAIELMRSSNCYDMIWSVEKVEFDQSIIIWHIATEICYYEDRVTMLGQKSDYINFKMSKLVSRYILYLLVFHPSKLPAVIGEIRYEDTLADAWRFFEDKKEPAGTSACGCNKPHKSRESYHLCKVCHLLQMRTDLPAYKLRADKSTSVLFDGCHLASQLKQGGRKWDLISGFWARMLMYSVLQSKGHEHCESLSRGGELLSHIWLLMAHLGMVQTVHPSGGDRITKLILT